MFSTKPGSTNLAEHRKETGSAKPVRQSPSCLPHAYRETVRQELLEMERDGIIESSTSEWASPIVLVPKKDGTIRMCVDYRRLSSVSEAAAYPMPQIDELIDPSKIYYDVGSDARLLTGACCADFTSTHCFYDPVRIVSVYRGAIQVACGARHVLANDGRSVKWDRRVSGGIPRRFGGV